MLHTVNKSPFERNAFNGCLQVAKDGHSVLLFEDGVYAGLKGTSLEEAVKTALANNVKMYVLTSDLEARGMRTEQLIDGIQSVDYSGFVGLAVDNNPIQAWL
jgi:tRNA 2-thiouridine synthesizing protein B